MHDIAGTVDDDDSQRGKGVYAAGFQTAQEQLQDGSQLVAHDALPLKRKNVWNPIAFFSRSNTRLQNQNLPFGFLMTVLSLYPLLYVRCILKIQKTIEVYKKVSDHCSRYFANLQ
jgi:hypothetical protein